MNKKLMFALLLAVASGSSVVAADGDQPAGDGFGSKVKGATSAVLNAGVNAGMAAARAGKKVEEVVTWPVAQLLNLQDTPLLKHILSESVAGQRTNVTKHSPCVARLVLTAALGYVGWKNEKVNSFLKKIAKPITSRCCKDKK